jgi:hypothetical protein
MRRSSPSAGLRNFSAVHIQDYAPRRIDSFGPGDQFSIQRSHTGEVFFFCQQLRLERLQAGSEMNSNPRTTLVSGPPSATEPLGTECIGWPQCLVVPRKRSIGLNSPW